MLRKPTTTHYEEWSEAPQQRTSWKRDSCSKQLNLKIFIWDPQISLRPNSSGLSLAMVFIELSLSIPGFFSQWISQTSLTDDNCGWFSEAFGIRPSSRSKDQLLFDIIASFSQLGHNAIATPAKDTVSSFARSLEMNLLFFFFGFLNIDTLPITITRL